MPKHKPKSKPRPPPQKRQKTSGPPTAQKKHPQQQSQIAPAIPFAPADDVLLVGEGDFSFAHCLYTHHRGKWGSLTATSLDPAQDVVAKYPQAAGYIAAMTGNHAPGTTQVGDGEQDDEKDEEEGDEKEEEKEQKEEPNHPRIRILHGQDATQLHKGKRARSRRGGFDWAIFNFPHVGGRSTDVNRQVRSNQALLLAFFESVARVLVPPSTILPSLLHPGEEESDQGSFGDDDDERKRRTHSDGLGGRILVTLFEGAPYTLWNVRDVARAAGLRVERSWRFRWDAFPGYAHARTLGNLKSRAAREGQVEDGGEAARGAWKGEEREARCYAFYVPGKEKVGQGKRKKADSSDEE